MVVSAKGLFKTFTNTARILGTIACFLVFLVWAKLAVEKLNAKPVSSTITYKNGDNGKGLIEHPIVTVCPADLNFFAAKLGAFDAHCNCATTHTTTMFSFVCRKNYLWGNIFRDCFGDNGFNSINVSTKELYVEIHPLVYQLVFGKQFRVPKYRFDAFARKSTRGLRQKKEAFSSFFHEAYGTCWSFDSAMKIKPLVEPEEMLIDFGVCNLHKAFLSE